MENEIKNPPVRLLYLPNESSNSVQTSPRVAFEEMLLDHTLDAYQVFSYQVEADILHSFLLWENKFLNVVNEFQPTIIFWQHINHFPITKKLLLHLRDIPSKPLMIYHEGDAYGQFRKPMTPSMTKLTKFADITFVPGLGRNAELFRNAGSKKVIYAPSCGNTVTFGKPWNPEQKERCGVVMIGNNILDNPLYGLIPPLRFPGVRERREFAVRLCRKIGHRLKVYGSGWDQYPFAAGSVPYVDQENILRNHLLSVNWDHFSEIPFSFSDRLPNSLLSGVAHATSYHPGFEVLFKNGEQLMYYRSIQEAIDVIDWMLCQPGKYLIDMGIAGEEFVRKNLTTNLVYRRMVSIIKEELRSKITSTL